MLNLLFAFPAFLWILNSVILWSLQLSAIYGCNAASSSLLVNSRSSKTLSLVGPSGSFVRKLSRVQLPELLAQFCVTLLADVWELKSPRGTRGCSLETCVGSLRTSLLLVSSSVMDPKPHHLHCFFPHDLDTETLSRRDSTFTLELCAIKELFPVECSSPS